MLTEDEYEEYNVSELKKPISLSINCLSFVDSKGAAICDGMKRNLTSEELCSFEGLCPQEDPELKRDSMNELYDEDDFHLFKEPMLKEEVRPLGHATARDGCFFCTLIMNALEQSTANRRVDEEVMQVMDEVCENLPDPAESTCMDWLRKHAGIMIDGVRDFTLKEVCQRINACTLLGLSMVPGSHISPAKFYSLKINSVSLLEDSVNSGNLDSSSKSSNFNGSGKSNIHEGNSPTTAEQFDEGECKMCLYVLGNIKEQIPNARGHTQPVEIRRSLTGLCNYLRKPESRTLCSNYVEETGDNVFSVLSSINPQELCTLFLACPTSAVPSSQSAESAQAVPKFHASSGTSPGNERGYLSLELLTDNNDDNNIGGNLSSGVKEEKENEATTVPMPILETDDCTICFNMAMIVYQMVNDDIPLELDQALQRACSVIHPLYYPRCTELMGKYQEQLRNKILMFPKLMITEYCKEFEPPVCPPSPMYGLDPGNLNPSEKSPNHYHRSPSVNVPSTTSDVDEGFNSEDELCTCLAEDTSPTPLDQNLPLAGFDYEAEHETTPCELCLHALFFVGPLMKDPSITIEQVHNALINSCNGFKGERYEQCRKLIAENELNLEDRLFSKPRIPFYEVCYVMTDPLCSGAYTNKRLRDTLMDRFLAEFPEDFRGNAETFDFAQEVSELVATILFFREDLYSFGNLSFADTSTKDRTTTTNDKEDHDNNELFSTSEPGGEEDGTQCEICNEIINRVKPYIQISILQPFLHSEIVKSCYHIQPLHFSKCLQFVANYSNMLHETALYDISKHTEDICTLTEPRFCFFKPQTLPAQMLHPLGSGSLMREIALKVCEKIVEKLLGGLENVCQTFLDRHWPEENQYYGTSDVIRGSIKDCDICLEMMTAVSMEKNSLKIGNFDHHNSLHQSCQFLPTPHRRQCQVLLKSFADKMVPYLERYPNHPMDVCTKLHPSPCNPHRGQNRNNDNDSGDDDYRDVRQGQAKTSQLFVNQILIQVRYFNRPNRRLQGGLSEKQEDNSPDCLLCQDMVKEVRKRLMLNHSKSVLEATENVCQYLPKVSRHNCSEIVAASGAKIEEGLKWFVYDSPEYVCEQSELCDPDQVDTDSKEPCKEGPGFWCLSFQNAEQCDKIEYCQAKYRHDDD